MTIPDKKRYTADTLSMSITANDPITITFTDTALATTGTTALGDIQWNNNTLTWEIYTVDTVGTTTDSGTWISIPSVTYPYQQPYQQPFNIEFDKWNTDIWPKQCECCDGDIKDPDSACSIDINSKKYWFHRKCFADKRNAKHIRSIIISEDLELV